MRDVVQNTRIPPRSLWVSCPVRRVLGLGDLDFPALALVDVRVHIGDLRNVHIEQLYSSRCHSSEI
jgi:hypothetical protein